jgi:TetR/AcrR family transcriptional regulator
MENRTVILDTALALFSARGYDAVGIQEVCEKSGFTKPTLYYYFGHKRGLLDAILDRDYAALLEKLRSTVIYRGDLVLSLELIFRTCYDFARGHPVFYRLVLALYFAPPDSEPHQAVSGYNHGLQQFIENVFVSAVTQHGNLRGRHRLYAATYLGIINTYIGFYLNGYLEPDDQLVFQVVHQFMYGIFS